MFNPAQEQVIDRFKHPQHSGHLDQPELVAHGSNPFCGDEVQVEVMFDSQGKVSKVSHASRACAVCTAAADLLAEEIIGKTRGEISQITPGEMEKLIGLPLSPLRLKCAFLPLEALKQALTEPLK